MPFFPPATQGNIGATKKFEVRTFSGLPSHLLQVYGYLSNQYSSRKIEQAAKQNIYYMWLSAMSYTDHNTINRFRSDRLKGVLKEVFSQVVLLLVEKGIITSELILLLKVILMLPS